MQLRIDGMARFIRQRQVLQERVDETRGALDHWLQEHPDTASMGDVAFLEGLLATRRDLFEELTRLDDDWLDAILTFGKVEQPSEPNEQTA